MRFYRVPHAFGWIVALFLMGSCGDTTSDLITRAEPEAQECESDTGCDGATPHCDTGSGVCRGCLEAAHCSTGQICVLPIGSCAEPCSTGDCPTANPICDSMSGLCRGCASDVECPEASPVCDTSNGRCVECASSEACDGEEPFCDGGRCVECLESGHCREQGEGCSPMGQCAVPCDDSTSCSLFDDPICDVSGYCVECLSPADCDDGETCVQNECEDLEDDEEEEEDEAQEGDDSEEADDED